MEAVEAQSSAGMGILESKVEDWGSMECIGSCWSLREMISHTPLPFPQIQSNLKIRFQSQTDTKRQMIPTFPNKVDRGSKLATSSLCLASL